MTKTTVCSAVASVGLAIQMGVVIVATHRAAELHRTTSGVVAQMQHDQTTHHDSAGSRQQVVDSYGQEATTAQTAAQDTGIDSGQQTHSNIVALSAGRTVSEHRHVVTAARQQNGNQGQSLVSVMKRAA